MRTRTLINAFVKPFQCSHPGCTRSYTNNSHLRRHISISHQEQQHRKSYRCNFPGCGMLLRHEGNVKRHFERCHKPKQQRFPCGSCNESFAKKRGLLAHSYIHTGISPFRCETCNMGFLRANLLMKHLSHHRQYKCDFPECKEKGVCFQKRNAYRKHRKECHQQTYHCAHCKYHTTNKSALNVHVIQHLNVHEKFIFSCPHTTCTRFYFYKKNLTNHIQRVHNHNRFPCPHPGCDKSLCSKTKLTMHLKIHEPNYVPRGPPKRGNRTKRKDACVAQRSCAVKLSGVRVPLTMEKAFLEISGDVKKLCNESLDPQPSIKSEHVL